jgi:hypothetical protein
MPDARDFDRSERAALGWAGTFAALPQETPDAGAWQRVQARLPATIARRRVRWPLWLASAASLALAIAIPVQLLPRAAPEASVPPSQVPAAAASPSVAVAAPPSIASETQPASTPTASRGTPQRATGPSPSQRPIRTVGQPVEATRVAVGDESASAGLEPLYAQSAQLESLLAMARDERMASGTSAALADGLDERVAAIDATLIQPGLSDAQRSELWRQRVDALRQLVGIETTNRLYAARGQSYQAALVGID